MNFFMILIILTDTFNSVMEVSQLCLRFALSEFWSAVDFVIRLVFLASGLLVYHEFSYGAFRSSVFLSLAFGYRASVIHPKQLGYKFENDV